MSKLVARTGAVGRSLLAVAVVGALMFGVSGKADADVYASSILQVDNGLFTGTSFTGFATTTFILNGTTANVNGVAANAAGVGPNGATTLDTSVAFSNGVATCVSAVACSTFSNNVFFPVQGPLDLAGNYAVADTHELNTKVAAGLGQWGSETQAQLTGGTTGFAEVGTANTLQWNFTLLTDGSVTFSGNLTQNLHTFLTVPGTLARAIASFDVTIQDSDGNPIASLFSLSLACSGSTRTAPGSTHPAACDGPPATPISGSTDLLAGDYSLLITFDTRVDVAQPAPAPSALIFMGTGLLGVGLMLRRRFGK